MAVSGAKKLCSFMGETRQDYHERSSRVEKVRVQALLKVDRPLRRAMLIHMRLRRQLFSIEVAAARST